MNCRIFWKSKRKVRISKCQIKNETSIKVQNNATNLDLFYWIWFRLCLICFAPYLFMFCLCLLGFPCFIFQVSSLQGRSCSKAKIQPYIDKRNIISDIDTLKMQNKLQKISIHTPSALRMYRFDLHDAMKHT